MSHLKPKAGLSALAVSLFALIAVSCEEPLIPEDFQFSFSPKEVTIPATGGSAEVAFNAPIAWKASTEAAWIQFSPESGEPGDVVLKVTVSENPAREARSATITVSLPEAEYTETFQVTQQAHEAALEISAESMESPGEGDSKALTVSSTVNWTATSDSPWLQASPERGGFGETQVTVTAAENPYPEERVGHISFSGEGLTKTLTVTQHSSEPWLVVSTTEASAPYSGGTVEFTVSSNVSWRISGGNGNWFSVSPVSGGFGETSVKITVAENKSVNSRQESFYVQGPDNLSTSVSLYQDGAPASISISVSEKEFTAAASSLEVTVESNTEWSVNASANWAVASVSGNKVTVSVAANDSPDTRTCDIVFTAQDARAVLKITQKGKQETGGISGGIGDWGEGGTGDYGKN